MSERVPPYADLPTFDITTAPPWDVPAYEMAPADHKPVDLKTVPDVAAPDVTETKAILDVVWDSPPDFDTSPTDLAEDSQDTSQPQCTCGTPDAPCAIGSTSVTLASDVHPELPIAIYYPACSPQQDAPVALGHHPVFIFGHGYQQSVPDYQYIWQALVPLGIIVALPDRLTGAAEIDIDGFADDFVYIAAALAMNDLDSDSLFYRRVSGKIAVGGHSTGGGASIVAASNMRPEFKPKAVVLLAPLGTLDKKPMTGPYPLDAAAVLHSPTLLQEAQWDCILKNDLNSQPIWNNIPFQTPAWLATITDADHCGFTWIDGPLLWLCEAAEKGLCWDFKNDRSTQPPTIGSEIQNQLALDLAVPFLSWHLFGNADAKTLFEVALGQAEFVSLSH